MSKQMSGRSEVKSAEQTGSLVLLLVVALVLQESHNALTSVTLHSGPIRPGILDENPPHTLDRLGLPTISSSDSSGASPGPAGC